eukprot:1147116-Pelagomonas_calceolata.AAC.1
MNGLHHAHSSQHERKIYACRSAACIGRKEPLNDSHQQEASFPTPATRNRSGYVILANILFAFRSGFRNMTDGAVPPQTS